MCYDPLRFILSFSDLFSFFFAAITCPGGVQTLGRGREGVEGSPPPRLPTRAVSLLMLTVLPHLPMTQWHLRICFPPPLCLASLTPRCILPDDAMGPSLLLPTSTVPRSSCAVFRPMPTVLCLPPDGSPFDGRLPFGTRMGMGMRQGIHVRSAGRTGNVYPWGMGIGGWEMGNRKWGMMGIAVGNGRPGGMGMRMGWGVRT